MSPREEAPPPNLLKPYPATLGGLRCAKCQAGGMDALCGACARAEVRALRRERRALRKVTPKMLDAALLSLLQSQREGFVLCPYTVDKALRAAINAETRKALKPRKARRAGRTK